MEEPSAAATGAEYPDDCTVSPFNRPRLAQDGLFLSCEIKCASSLRHPGHAHAFTGALASCKKNRIVTRYVGAEPADCEVRIERQSGLRGGPCLVQLTKPR